MAYGKFKKIFKEEIIETVQTLLENMRRGTLRPALPLMKTRQRH